MYDPVNGWNIRQSSDPNYTVNTVREIKNYSYKREK